MIQSILVPLDGSAFGEQALPLAAAIAKASEAALHLVHVHVPEEVMFAEPMLFVPPEAVKNEEQQQHRYLSQVARRLATELPAAPTTAVLEGPVIDGIEKHAREVQADLVVMTTHGRGPLSRAW